MRNADGEINYTRNGDFTWALGDGNRIMLTTSDGLPVLSSTGQNITLGGDFITSRITISGDGTLMYPDENNNPQTLGFTIGAFQFRNPSGLERQGDTLYAVTASSGPVINEATNPNVRRSKLVQGYLEGSNVKVADEMVNLIVAQRAYEMNSKAITTTDEMMQQANNLKR